jgi:hypothetical protein
MITDLDKPSHRPGVIVSDVLNEMVVYNADTSQAVSLNESARAIWKLCGGTRTIDDICAELANCTGLSPAQLHDDVRNAIERLHDLNLLTSGTT